MTNTERARATIRSLWTIVLEKGDGDPLTVFAKLHSIICMNHGWDPEGRLALDDLVDLVEIARECDRILGAAARDFDIGPPDWAKEAA